MFQVTVGAFSGSGGTIASELTVKGIADDTAVTCKVRSADGDDSVKSDDILTFGLSAYFQLYFRSFEVIYFQLVSNVLLL